MNLFKTNNLHRVLLVLGLMGILGIASSAMAQDVEATAGWSPPTFGTPVVHYVLQHSVNDGAWTTVATTTETEYTFTISFTDNHRVRVAGMDAEGRQGPYSLPSDSYNPSEGGGGEDGPNQPGRPTLF